MEEKEKLAINYNCARMLWFNGFVTNSEYDKIVERIMKWQDANKVEISQDQLDSVEFIFKSE